MGRTFFFQDSPLADVSTGNIERPFRPSKMVLAVGFVKLASPLMPQQSMHPEYLEFIESSFVVAPFSGLPIALDTLP